MGTRIVLLAIVIATVWAAMPLVRFIPRWIDQLEGRGVASRLDALVAAAADGATVDLGDAYRTDWDRVILIGGYWSGSVANSQLGFDYFDPDETLSYADAPHRMVFVRGSDVLADVDVQTFTFDEEGVVIAPSEAQFRVSRTATWTTLMRLE